MIFFFDVVNFRADWLDNPIPKVPKKVWSDVHKVIRIREFEPEWGDVLQRWSIVMDGQ